MKKFFALAMLFGMLVSFAGCDQGGGTGTDTGTTGTGAGTGTGTGTGGTDTGGTEAPK